MWYHGGGVRHMATQQCNRTLLADEHTVLADEHIPLAQPQPTANQDNESEGDDLDEGGNEGDDDIDRANLLSHSLNDTADILNVARFAAL